MGYGLVSTVLTLQVKGPKFDPPEPIKQKLGMVMCIYSPGKGGAEGSPELISQLHLLVGFQASESPCVKSKTKQGGWLLRIDTQNCILAFIYAHVYSHIYHHVCTHMFTHTHTCVCSRCTHTQNLEQLLMTSHLEECVPVYACEQHGSRRLLSATQVAFCTV